jgi:hypothetical protein
MQAAPAVPPRSSRQISIIRCSRIAEGIPNLGNPAADAFEKALRAKYDFSLFYPRAVNEMRMFAAAAEKAKSLDPVKPAAALEGMEFDVYDGGKGTMRKGMITSSSSPVYRLARRSHGEGTVRRGKDRLGLEASCEDRAGADHAPHHLQNGAPELTVVTA